jgi:hypothetical protein
MSTETLEGIMTEFVAQNSTRIGRALAQAMLASLGRPDLSAEPQLAPFVPDPHPLPAQQSTTSQKPVAARRSAGKTGVAGPPTVPRFPGSAKDNDQKIVAAIPDKGIQFRDLMKKTGFPEVYLRSRLNRLIREKRQIRTEGKTSKARYFKV